MTSQKSGSASASGLQRILPIMSCLALALPILPLLIPRPFYLDWINHVWAISYFRDSLLTHGNFPTLFNVAQGAGNPSPVFYGYLLYPLLAVVSLLVGADGALRISSAILIVATTATYFFYLKGSLKTRSHALLMAIVLTSSVYQMTNLYNRSAITEFFAHQMILLALPLLFMGLRSFSRAHLSTGCALLCGAFGTNPITFYLFMIFVSPLIAWVAFCCIRRAPRLLIPLVPLVALMGVILAPWLTYVFLFKSSLQISIASQSLTYFPAAIDSWYSKLLPFSLDIRVLSDGIFQTSTPFLDAPLNLTAACLAFVVIAKVRRNRWIDLSVFLILFLALAVPVTAMSLPPPSSISVPSAYTYGMDVRARTSMFYDLLMPIQFAYRLTNTFLLQVAVFLIAMIEFGRDQRAAGMTANEDASAPFREGALLLAFLASFIVTSAKTLEIFAEFFIFPSTAAVVAQRNTPGSADQADPQRIAFMYSYEKFAEVVGNTGVYPKYYLPDAYAMKDVYIVKDELPSDRQPVTAEFRSDHAGETEVTVNCRESCVVQTNIEPTPLISLTVNGHVLPPASAFEHAGRIYLLLDAGDYVVRLSPQSRLLYSFTAARALWMIWLLGSIAALAWASFPIARRMHATQT